MISCHGIKKTNGSVFSFMEKKRPMLSEKKKELDENIWDCGSPLYDSYELASISRILERHTIALPYPCYHYDSMRSGFISNKPEPEGRSEGKMGNLHALGLFRKVVSWTLWKTRIGRYRNNKDEKV
ncbi:hypothetical protein ERO13_D12G236050v2 [Gossypium hirsutum]|nr:hypothetical protein ERO13_D12G236050v2 [Gossypium hirsutum]